MHILILSLAGLRIIFCQEIAPNYGASFRRQMSNCLYASMQNPNTLVYPQFNKKYFNFINLLTFEESQFPGRSFSCNLMGGKRCSNNCERWISVKVGERKVLKKIEHVLLYSLTKMQKTAKNYHVTLKYQRDKRASTFTMFSYGATQGVLTIVVGTVYNARRNNASATRMSLPGRNRTIMFARSGWIAKSISWRRRGA